MSHKDSLRSGYTPSGVDSALNTQPINPALIVAAGLGAAGLGMAAIVGGSDAAVAAAMSPWNVTYTGGSLAPGVAQMFANIGASLAINGVVTAKLVEIAQQKQAGRLEVRSLVEAGCLPLRPNPGHLAVFAGNGDAICSRVISPYTPDQAVIYGHSRDAVGGRPIWVKTATPDASASQTLFGKSLEIGRLASAGHILLSATNEQQLFLPDPDNPAHHDMNFAQIRAMLLLLRRANAHAHITLVADRMLGERILSNDEVYRKHVKLGEYLLEQSGLSKLSGITLIDPTDVIMDHLASDSFNPNHLPIRLISTEAGIEEYAQRFQERASKRPTAKNPLRPANNKDGKVLNVSYDTSGLKTAIPTDSSEVTHGLAVGDEGSSFGPDTININIAEIVTQAISHEINRAVPFESVQPQRGSGTIFSFARDVIHGPRNGNRRSR